MTKPIHSPDAEAAVLGGVLLNNGVLVSLPLEVEDFYDPKHQAVYQAMRCLEATMRPIDPVTVEAELARVGKSEAIGGLGFVSELSLRVPIADNVRHYAAIVIRLANRRAAIRALTDRAYALATLDDETDGEDAIVDAIGALQRIDLRTPDPTIPLGESVRREFDRISREADERLAGRHVGGMPTGLTELDEKVGGLPIGVTTLVLGETGHGKSTLAMKFLRAAVEQAGDEPLCFSYEDGHTSFAQRRLAQATRVPTRAIARRTFNSGHMRDLAAGAGAAMKSRERIAAYRGQTVEELCRTVRRLRARGPKLGGATVGRLVVVDYLQAIPKPFRRGISTPEAIGEITHALEDLAAQEQIAVAVMSQVNDEPARRDDHRPQGRDVAGSRDPFKGCKLCLGIYRPAEYDEQADPRFGELLILKNNQGPLGMVPIRLDLETHTIRDAEVV